MAAVALACLLLGYCIQKGNEDLPKVTTYVYLKHTQYEIQLYKLILGEVKLRVTVFSMTLFDKQIDDRYIDE